MTIPRVSPGSVVPRAGATAGIGRGSSPALLFGIPLGVLASVGALGAYYVLEHPERRKADIVPARREVRLALERAGFFTNFGFVASAAVAIELAAGRGVSNTWRWRLLIAYVASNHALYFAHTATGTGACPEASTGAGAGAMLAASDRGFLRRLFDEHRLADVIVHAGGVVASRGRRLDHLVSLVEHLRRYAGVAPRRAGGDGDAWNNLLRLWTSVMEFKLWMNAGGSCGGSNPAGSISVADFVDVVAHARTATKTLSPAEIAVGLAACEAIRRSLRLDLIKHHRHTWADVRRALSQGRLKTNKSKGKKKKKTKAIKANKAAKAAKADGGAHIEE